ncbi:MAG: hypothetical protein HGA44_10130 [Cellulomonadaceae bacterium]|nr:hypothetical protein [Cellulomonadaceae bacterium]
MDERPQEALASRAHHLAGAIYGTILATTVVAGAGHDPDVIDRTAVIVAGTSLVFWVAHVYSLWVAARLVLARPLDRREIVSVVIAEWPMLQSSWPILVSLGLGAVGVLDRSTAIDLAMLVGIGALFAYGALIGRREQGGWPRVLLNALVCGAFGIAILALKVLVH